MLRLFFIDWLRFMAEELTLLSSKLEDGNSFIAG